MRPKLLWMLSASLLALAACGDDSNQQAQTPPAAPIAPDTATATAGNISADQLLRDALAARSVQPGRLVPDQTQVLLDIQEGQSGTATITLSNRGGSGNRDITISSIIGASNSPGLTLSGSCASGFKVSPGLSCEVIVNYQAITGRSLDTTLIVQVQDAETPQVEIPLRITVIPKPRPPEPVVQAPQQRPRGPEFDPAFVAALNAARSARYNGAGQGGVLPPSATLSGAAGGLARPQVHTRFQDPRYNPDQVPWTETSLPVNRRNILTADRVITATLETPVSSQLCNQVAAVVNQNVFSPDGVNVLIPRGTRVLGRCQAFTDERVAIQWFRMLTPNGVNITFQKLLADSAASDGTGGVPGRVRERAFDRYAAPFLSSAIDLIGVVGRVAYGQDQTRSVDPVTGRETQTQSRWDQAIDDFNDTARTTLQNSLKGLLDTRRSVVVPGGTRMEIQIQEDIYFKSPTEVVKLADYEYEIRQNARQPQAVEQAPPTLGLVPRVDGARPGSDPSTVRVGGRTYTIQPSATAVDPTAQAPGTGGFGPAAEGQQPGVPGGMRSGVQGEQGFYQTPNYAAPQNPNRRDSFGGYGGSGSRY